MRAESRSSTTCAIRCASAIITHDWDSCGSSSARSRFSSSNAVSTFGGPSRKGRGVATRLGQAQLSQKMSWNSPARGNVHLQSSHSSAWCCGIWAVSPTLICFKKCSFLPNFFVVSGRGSTANGTTHQDRHFAMCFRLELRQGRCFSGI